MSNLSDRPLRIQYQDLEIPHADCNQSGVNLRKQNKDDHCHVILTLTDRQSLTNPGDEPDTYRLRFDRNVTQFQLQTKPDIPAGEFANSQDAINWFIRHGDSTNTILDIVRILGTTLSSAGVAQEELDRRNKNAVFPLVIANYIITGQVIFPNDPSVPKTERDLEAKVLDVFANSDPASVQDFIGKISYFKGDSSLDEGARGRAAYIDSILGHVPRYKTFLEIMIPPSVVAEINLEDSKTMSHWAVLETFTAQAIIQLQSGKMIPYDSTILEAFRAFNALHAEAKSKKDFCSSLAEADQAINKKRGSKLGGYFVEECHQGIRLSQEPPRDAVALSIQTTINSSQAKAKMQSYLRQAIDRSNAELPWLSKDRPHIKKISEIVLRNTKVKAKVESPPEGPLPEGEEKIPPSLKNVQVEINTAQLKADLLKLIKKENALTHREPVVAALAVLQLIFYDYDPKAIRQPTQETIRVFINGSFQEVPLQYNVQALEETIKILERDLGTSLKRSDRDWIIAQGVVGGLGVGALTTGLALRPGQAPRPVPQTLFIGGSTAVGCALGSLVQRSRRAHNKHLWGGVGCAVGGLLFGGVSAVVGTQTDLFKGKTGMEPPGPMPGPGDRNPVDDYGP